jgi:tRNA dimethylallyltransferase
MFNQGLIDETQYLLEKYQLTSDSQSMKIIGYRHILDYLRSNMSIDDLKNKCLFATRQLAKRQITWLKQFPCNHGIDILDNDFTITYKVVDSHCNLDQ